MAIVVVERRYMIVTLLFALTCHFSNLTHCFRPKKLNVSAVTTSDSDWSIAAATFYGEPNGYGSDAGACGYRTAVAQPPFSSMVSAGGASLFKSGIGCGACYQVKCTSNSECSKDPVTVVITDACLDCYRESVHFDLSDTAFGAMAISGQGSQLRNAGVLEILYKKVECNFAGETVTFRVDEGSNDHYFAALVAYGDGEIGQVELKQALVSDTWLSMSHLWGAVWKLQVSSPLRAPLSLRVTSLQSGQTVVATDAIPAGWPRGANYKSNVNFQV
ncbi:PREDICTED: putative expansin-B2 [Camelina sativa]|uniref:Expansin-B2 n=1 Tax=Camelina sativa TaxID=90675 RepID=A0ABM0UGY8_CAMSA|nr:PREDICTED: putative expansin-B2 [Camelina sativa]